ncbi:MAG: hypothetical protein ACHQX1_01385 [Candidatus Micrarchaeales archaeon]
MRNKPPYNVRINRNTSKVVVTFTEVFEGFENVPPVRKTFGKNTKNVLSSLKVHIPKKAKWNYMWIDDNKGRLVVSRSYLKRGNSLLLYLDVIHELVHIKQHRQGKDLFDEKYEYVDRPTEIEAYKTAAREAKRIGWSKSEIIKYLEVKGWIDGNVLKRLCKNIGMQK